MAAHPKKMIPVEGLEVLWDVCGQEDLHRDEKDLKAMGMGLEEQVPSKPALTDSWTGLAQLEDVCCKCLCPFLLILSFSGRLCHTSPFSSSSLRPVPGCSRCPGSAGVNPAPR